MKITLMVWLKPTKEDKMQELRVKKKKTQKTNQKD